MRSANSTTRLFGGWAWGVGWGTVFIKCQFQRVFLRRWDTPTLQSDHSYPHHKLLPLKSHQIYFKTFTHLNNSILQ